MVLEMVKVLIYNQRLTYDFKEVKTVGTVGVYLESRPQKVGTVDFGEVVYELINLANNLPVVVVQIRRREKIINHVIQGFIVLIQSFQEIQVNLLIVFRKVEVRVEIQVVIGLKRLEMVNSHYVLTVNLFQQDKVRYFFMVRLSKRDKS